MKKRYRKVIPKWRGIQTTQKKKNEIEPMTIINRFGQLSISLPRIDDQKRWAGYPGITGVSPQLARLVPKETEMYIEPFAGTAKVYQEYIQYLKPNPLKMVYFLNDKSKFIYRWLKNNFGKHESTYVFNYDFRKFLHKSLDWKKVFFMIDHPWFQSYYDQDFSYFNMKNVKEYDKKIIQICKQFKNAKFIITTRKENTVMLNSGFNNYLLESQYVVCGRYPKVLLTTNLDLDRRKGVEKVDR